MSLQCRKQRWGDMVTIPGYQIVKELGSGAMATVYLAVQTSLERKVALKVLKHAGGPDAARAEQRFLREARALARLNHRNVCAIYDIGQTESLVYLAMEYLDGGTLHDRLRAGMSLPEAISIIVQLASGLRQAHEQGIVHRDLKPSNVMMRGGVPVLTDFGVARELSAQTRLTQDNMVLGTPVYMAPEQVQGGQIDGRADLYALGIVLHELLTGRPPYSGDTALAVCMQHLTAPLPQLPEHLHTLQPVLDRLLAKSADERYATADDFITALKQLVLENQDLKHTLSIEGQGSTTEQLRALGFSLEASHTDLKALRASQSLTPVLPGVALARGMGKASPAPASAEAEQAPARPSRLPWIFAGVAVLLLLSVALTIWLTQAGPSRSEQTALNALAREFDELVGKGMLFEPPNRNAVGVLAEMRLLPEAPITRTREEALITAIARAARDALSQQDEAAVTRLLKASSTALSVEDQKALVARIDKERQYVANAKAAESSIVAITEAINAPPATLEPIYAALDEVQRLLPAEDPRRQNAEAAVIALAAERIQRRLASLDGSGAAILLRPLRERLPSAPEVLELERGVAALSSPERRQLALARLGEALNRPGTWDLALVAAVLDEWTLVAANDPQRVLLAPSLAKRLAEALTAAQRRQPAEAGRLLDRARALLPGEEALKAAG